MQNPLSLSERANFRETAYNGLLRVLRRVHAHQSISIEKAIATSYGVHVGPELNLEYKPEDADPSALFCRPFSTSYVRELCGNLEQDIRSEPFPGACEEQDGFFIAQYFEFLIGSSLNTGALRIHTEWSGTT